MFKVLIKVLIIEDNQLLSDKLTHLLKGDGYDVSQEADGSKGLDKVKSLRPELVILDIMLPTLDGLSVCKSIKTNPSISNTRIIIISSRGTEDDKITALNTGADDYLVKPFSNGELLARVRVVLRRTSTQIQFEQLVSGNLTVSIESRKVFLDGIEIQFTRKEFELLVFFMRNKKAILSRSTIITGVWGSNYVDNCSRIVDTHVNALRKKIEQDTLNPIRITTFRDIGYCFQG